MRSRIFLSAAALAALLTGCENKTQTGALVGAGTGALAGGYIGHSAGGAIVGGAIGAAGGALIGSALDSQDRKIMEMQSPHALQQIDRGQQLGIVDIKEMSSAGIDDRVIINQIQVTGSIYYLSSRDIIDLKNSGVSQNVIDAMISTGYR